ncbi:MAG: D-cysteine desulfhydrase family protein [Kiloniellales bacterium]|nr:D-cysteine desulfhydrase family protein [Kiloniellales bacterium]
MGAPLGRLDSFPRAALGHLPTPLEPLPNLSASIGRRLFVKRDDCTGLALGGNKVRQLEFYLGEALAQRADTVLITGAVQSNFVRLAAAAACKLGLACEVQLEDRVPGKGETYRRSGNALLDRLFGAVIHHYPDGEDEAGADRRIKEIAEALKAEGRRPYVIPLAPGHPPLGALGYVAAAQELLAQCGAAGLGFDEIVVASGSGHTHAGLLFGLRALGCDLPVTGICVRRAAGLQHPRIVRRCREIAELIEAPNPVADADVLVDDRDLAPGYGRLNPAVREAVDLAARREGLLLDPVYTGRTLAGLLRRAEALAEGARLLFVHTGGTPALFAYQEDFGGAG